MRGPIPADALLDRTAPEGFRLVWQPDAEWTTDPEVLGDGLCRRMGPEHVMCEKPAVAALRRSDGHWWRYCEDHLYGRRVRGDAIEFLRAVPAAEASP